MAFFFISLQQLSLQSIKFLINRLQIATPPFYVVKETYRSDRFPAVCYTAPTPPTDQYSNVVRVCGK